MQVNAYHRQAASQGLETMEHQGSPSEHPCTYHNLLYLVYSFLLSMFIQHYPTIQIIQGGLVKVVEPNWKPAEIAETCWSINLHTGAALQRPEVRTQPVRQ